MAKSYDIPVDAEVGGVLKNWHEANHNQNGNPHDQYVLKKGHYILGQSDSSKRFCKLFDVKFGTDWGTKMGMVKIISQESNPTKFKFGRIFFCLGREDSPGTYTGRIVLLEGEGMLLDNVEATFTRVENGDTTVMSFYFCNDSSTFNYAFTWALEMESGFDPSWEKISLDIPGKFEWVSESDVPSRRITKRNVAVRADSLVLKNKEGKMYEIDINSLGQLVANELSAPYTTEIEEEQLQRFSIKE